MLDSNKYSINILFLILIFSLLMPIIIFAKEDIYEELPEMKGISVDGTITIPFDKPLSNKTIIVENIYVKDSNGAKVPIVRSLGEGGKSIIIKPWKIEYKKGETYTLYITKNIRYSSGYCIKNGLKMKFTVAKTISEKLPMIGTLDNLKKLLEEAGLNSYPVRDYSIKRSGVQTTAGVPEAAGAPDVAMNTSAAVSQKSKESSSDYSTTNVQVQGVDEADIVKTDGEYLYQVNNDKIVIAKIYPSDGMKMIKTIKLADENLYPMELYVDKERLIVIGTSTNNIPIARPAEKRIAIYPPRYSYGTVKLIEYDIKDKASINKSREIELEGNYLSSRKIGDKLYLISNKYIDYYHIMNEGGENNTPSYRDTAMKEEFVNIPLDKIAYFPDCVGNNYLIVAGVDLGKPKEGVNVSTYLGSGENIYASTENLYVALTKQVSIPKDPVIYDSANPKSVMPNYYDRETLVYRFALNGGKLDYTARVQCPEYIESIFYG